MTSIELDLRSASSTGLDAPVASALAYLAGPFSGVLILLAERTNRYVRFHAWQAVLGLGGLGLLIVLLQVSAFLGLLVAPALFKTLNVLALITGFLWLIVWGVCLVKAYGGSAWKLPVIGSLAERKASDAQ